VEAVEYMAVLAEEEKEEKESVEKTAFVCALL
jgi:hypothetical protein